MRYSWLLYVTTNGTLLEVNRKRFAKTNRVTFGSGHLNSSSLPRNCSEPSLPSLIFTGASLRMLSGLGYW